eukprot:scaffold47106_cov64-Phaeocystis_antarctica.AAC.3
MQPYEDQTKIELLRIPVVEGARGELACDGGAQDKAGGDEALGLVGRLGQVGVVGAHDAGVGSAAA